MLVGGSSFDFRVRYTDADNDTPWAVAVQVWVDGNDNGSYESDEKYNMTVARLSDGIYTRSLPVFY